ncbi:MAG: ATPase, partial [Patescibacteria group bacterium]
MKRCQRCIMPETVPGITFNRDGICDYCLNYQKERYFGKKELEKIIASIIKEENEYDCIVPLSGGRDSTYILYMAKAIYNLKVLAVSYDNEFRIGQALINMQNACQRLNVDFISVRSKRGIAQKIVKSSIRSSISPKRLGICQA